MWGRANSSTSSVWRGAGELMASSEIVGTTCSVRAYISTGIITIHPGASQGFGFTTCNVEVLKVSSLAS